MVPVLAVPVNKRESEKNDAQGVILTLRILTFPIAVCGYLTDRVHDFRKKFSSK